MISRKSSGEMEKVVYRYRFWGLPKGVAMLPRLAATVCKTITFIRCRRSPSRLSTRMAKGTKVIRATSLVMSMEEKKGSSTNKSTRARKFRFPCKSFWDKTANTLQLCSPATTTIREKSRQSTRRSR